MKGVTPARSPRPSALGANPCLAAVSTTRRTVESPTPPRPFSARETVHRLNPRNRASEAVDENFPIFR